MANKQGKISIKLNHKAYPDTIIFIDPGDDPEVARQNFIKKYGLDKPFSDVNFPSGWRKGKSPGRPKKFSKDDEAEEFFEEQE